MTTTDTPVRRPGNGGIPLRQLLVHLRARRLIDQLIGGWSTTPGQFRVVRATLVLIFLVASGVGSYVANIHNDSVREIADRAGPLSMDATELYRSMADLNATVTSGFLTNDAEPADVRELYDTHLTGLAARLTDAAARTADDPVVINRITDIGAQLPVYTGLVERARAGNRQGPSAGVADLLDASNLMVETIMTAAQQLQRIQVTRLDDEYQRAGSGAVLAAVLFAASLAGLVWAQIVLYRRTKRIFNVGLLVSTLAMAGALLWWTVGGISYLGYLQDSRPHSQSVTDALGPAQIAALNARANESLALLARDATAPSEERFDAEIEILARDQGAGGALGAARMFASDDHGRMLVEAAIDQTEGYDRAHGQVRELSEAGRHDEALAAAVGGNSTTTAAFVELDATLDSAARYERTEFDNDLARARGIPGGLLVGTGLLTLIAVIGVLWGIGQRLREFP